MEEGPKGPNS
jgi:chromosome segregation ATPase